MANSASRAASWRETPWSALVFEPVGLFDRSVNGSGELESVRDEDRVGEELPVEPEHEDNESLGVCLVQLRDTVSLWLFCVMFAGLIAESISTSPRRTKLPDKISLLLLEILSLILSKFFLWGKLAHQNVLLLEKKGFDENVNSVNAHEVRETCGHVTPEGWRWEISVEGARKRADWLNMPRNPGRGRHLGAARAQPNYVTHCSNDQPRIINQLSST